MKLTAISDVHVKQPHDDADRLLCQFLDHPQVQSSQHIALLGDIFDLMCGPHQQYLNSYSHIFKRMDDLQKAGKKIYFFEGNHDVHLENLFRKYWSKGELVPAQQPLIITIGEKTYYLSHGDEHEVQNLSYQKYKKTILSPPLRFVANHLLPFSLLNYIGQKASQLSRKKGSKYFDHEGVREKFREGVKITTGGLYDFILGGHSHVQDIFPIPGSHATYINNGYALKTRTFILIDNHQVSFHPLV